MEELYQKDQDFLAMLARGDRSELCTYRNRIIDELKNREERISQRKQKRLRYLEQLAYELANWSWPLMDFVVAWLLLWLAVLELQQGYTVLAVALLLAAALGVYYGIRNLRTVLTQRREQREQAAQAFCDELEAALDKLAAERKGSLDVEGASYRIQLRRCYDAIRHDDIVTLTAKKARLDEVLGFSAGPR